MTKKKQITHEPTMKPQCAHCGGVMKDGVALSLHMQQTACGRLLMEARERGFVQRIDVPDPTPEQAAARCEAVVARDRSSHTVIEVRRSENHVVFLAYMGSGVTVERLGHEAFDTQYTHVPDYPTGRAAALFVGFSQVVGGTTEALTELAKLINVSDVEKKMSSEKLATNKSTKTVTKTLKSSHGDVKVDVARKPRDSAAAMFKALITEGGITDAEIFAKVQKAFGLDESKRTYVAWYRNQLRKSGVDVPDALGGPRAKKAVDEKPVTPSSVKSAVLSNAPPAKA